MSTSETDIELTIRLAREAGDRLLELRQRMWAEGAHQWDVMDGGDQASHLFLQEELATHRPDDAILDEEGAEDPRRFSAERVWIIDPLDGTREFGEQGRTDWAVHVALWGDGDFIAGAVALPAANQVLATDPAPVVPKPERDQPRMITSRTRVPASAAIVANALGCEAVRLGSAGAKAMAVVNGLADIYVHDGGQYQWDSAAPVAVAQAAGLHCSRIDGSPLVYNDRDPWLPDVLVCRPEYAEPTLAAIAEHL